MPTPVFQGNATAVAQVNTETPDASPAINDVYTLVLTNRTGETHSISFTATATTVKNVVDGLAAAGQAATAAGDDPWDEVTVSEAPTDEKVLITANVAGVPFFVTASASGGGQPHVDRRQHHGLQRPGDLPGRG